MKLTFAKTPLRETLRQLADQQGIEVFLDKKALDDAKIAADAPVSASGSGESLEQSLDKLLAPLNLTCLVRDEVLLVTTAKAAQDLLETRVYKVLVLYGLGRRCRTASRTAWRPRVGKTMVVREAWPLGRPVARWS